MAENKRQTAKPKHEVLRDITKILNKYDVAETKSKDECEYEVEALSILTRLCETQVHLAQDENDAIDACNAIVAQTLQFWFGDDSRELDITNLSLELLNAYVSSFPEQKPEDVPEDEPVHVVSGEQHK